jgi:hypothetical protein
MRLARSACIPAAQGISDERKRNWVHANALSGGCRFALLFPHLKPPGEKACLVVRRSRTLATYNVFNPILIGRRPERTTRFDATATRRVCGNTQVRT